MGRPIPDGGDVHLVGESVLHHFGIAAGDANPSPFPPRPPCARTSASRISVASPASRMKLTTIASARAPETARSFTVPFTASSPMDPPGKRSGLTTKLSVVMATRASPTVKCVASPSGSFDPPIRIGAINPSTSRRLALPPAPCAISICGSRKRILTGAVVMLNRRKLREHRRFAMFVLIIRRAGAFVRHHQRAHRTLRSTFLAEQLALRRLQHAFENLAALGGLRIRNAHSGHGENALRIPLRPMRRECAGRIAK